MSRVLTDQNSVVLLEGMMDDMTFSGTPSDNPIASSSEDVLNRVGLAEALAEELRRVDASSGYVMALMGPWGSGKTSVVNLVREQLQIDPALTIVDFNPWMFSGVDALVSSFLSELSSQLRGDNSTLYGTVVDKLDQYSDALTPLVWIPGLGAWPARIKTLIGAAKRSKDKGQKSVRDIKNDVSEALSELSRPIVVVIDDIDRLSSADIQSMFKLVRLTANFPNVSYLLVFDRARVEQALTEQGMPGRNYLEKIVQSGIDLPAVGDEILIEQVTFALQSMVDSIGDVERFDPARWSDVLMEIVLPLIRTMRDVRRFISSSRLAVKAVKNEVELSDILALEAIRVFAPDVFDGIIDARVALTTSASGPGYAQASDDLKAEIDQFLTIDEGRRGLVESVIRQLFPAAVRHVGGNSYGSDWHSTWIKGRRVAHPEVLSTYLERVISPKMRSISRAEGALPLMADLSAFQSYVESVPLEELEETIRSLLSVTEEFSREMVVPGVTVLANVLDVIPERPLGMFDLGSRTVIGQVIYRLLNVVQDEDDVRDYVLDILPSIRSLSSRFDVVGTVGFIEGLGHHMVSESAARSFEEVLRDQIAEADDASLAAEWDLFRLFIAVRKWFDPPVEVTARVEQSAAFHRTMFDTAKNEMRNQVVGTRHVGRTLTLPWDSLVAIYESERNIELAKSKMSEAFPGEIEDLLAVIDRYLAGWRPDH